MPRMSPRDFMATEGARDDDAIKEPTMEDLRQSAARDRIAGLKRFRGIMSGLQIEPMQGVSLLNAGWETGFYRFGTSAGPCEARMEFSKHLISILVWFDDPARAWAGYWGHDAPMWHVPRWSLLSETSGKWNEHILPDDGPKQIAHLLDLFEILMREIKAKPGAPPYPTLGDAWRTSVPQS